MDKHTHTGGRRRTREEENQFARKENSYEHVKKFSTLIKKVISIESFLSLSLLTLCRCQLLVIFFPRRLKEEKCVEEKATRRKFCCKKKERKERKTFPLR